jgi:beta-phosphoglucomutase-like phosphatase (HAD superfamily)
MIAGCFKLVIFDCDGVLVDSEPIINRAHAEVLTACGYQLKSSGSGPALIPSLHVRPFTVKNGREVGVQLV